MDNVVDGMVIAALVSALFSIFGFVRVIYPKCGYKENCAIRFLRVHSNGREHDRAFSLGGAGLPASTISDIHFEFLTGATFHIIRLVWIGGRSYFWISGNHYAPRAFCRMRRTGSQRRRTELQNSQGGGWTIFKGVEEAKRNYREVRRDGHDKEWIIAVAEIRY